MNDQEIDVSEEARDFVHDLNGTDVPLQSSANLVQESGIEYADQNQDGYQNRRNKSQFQRKINNGSGYRSQESVDNMHNQLAVIDDMREFSDGRQEDRSYVQLTKFNINMEHSFQEFNQHVQTCNQDFKENIIRQVQTIKLKDTSELNKAVEEVKNQEAFELKTLNKKYMELDLRSKKLDKKNDRYEFLIEETA